jgi:hypothetical protein
MCDGDDLCGVFDGFAECEFFEVELLNLGFGSLSSLSCSGSVIALAIYD